MIKYEGQINKFFTRQAVADVVTGLPKLQTPMMDLLFPAGARKQKASPFLSLEEVTGAIGTVPLTARGGSSVSIDGTGKKRSIIEPCELKPSTFIAARDLNDLIASGDAESIQAEMNDRIAELRDTVVLSSETMTRQAFSGKITALMTYGYDGYKGTGSICLGIDERRQHGSCRACENGAQNRRNLQLDL